MEVTRITLLGHTFAECFTLNENFRLVHEMRNDACLAYIQSGTQEVYSQTQKIVANDNESIFMKCGNYIANFSDVSPTSQFKSVVFHLDPETIKKAFGEQELSFLKVSRSYKVFDPALKIEQSELLDSFVNSMMPYFNHPSLVREELLLLKLKELVYLLSDSGDNEVVSYLLGTMYTREEVEFDEIISANIYNNLSIAELAHLTAKSESSFKRYFTKYYQVSPAKYFKEKRLEKAADLLKNSGLLISEIAWDCGFENAAHFSDSFRSFYGSSPKNYRT